MAQLRAKNESSSPHRQFDDPTSIGHVSNLTRSDTLQSNKEKLLTKHIIPGKMEQFKKNHSRMLQLQALLEQVNYAMLGETAESKTIYTDLKEQILTELKQLNKEQKALCQTNQ